MEAGWWWWWCWSWWAGGEALFGEDKRQLAVMKDDSIKLISLIRHTLAKDCGEGGKERKRVDSAHC